MGRTRWTTVLQGALALLVGAAESSRFVGNVTMRGDWQVISNFEFGSEGGTADGLVFVPHDSKLVVYDDSKGSWSALKAERAVTCEKATLLQARGGYAKKVVDLSGNTANKVSLHMENDKKTSKRWYFALARCRASGRQLSSTGTVALMPRSLASVHPSLSAVSRVQKYHAGRYHAYYGHRFHHLGEELPEVSRIGKIWIDLHVLSTHNDGWSTEFPADEVLLLPGTILFLLAFSGLCYFLGMEFATWRNRNSFVMTSPVVFYAVSSICAAETLSLLLSFFELVSFASRGVERIDSISFLRLLSSFIEEVSRLATVMLLVLLSTGWMILTPKLQDADCFIQFGWILSLFYLLASIGSMVFSSSPNFTDEYHGVLWGFVLCTESFILLYGLGSAMHTLLFSENLRKRNFSGGANTALNASQNQVRFNTLVSISGLISFLLVQDWVLALLSGTVESWSQADWIFLISTSTHVVVCATLVFLFRPTRLELLQQTRASAADVIAAKAIEYGEDEDDIDFDGVQPFMSSAI